MNAIRYAMNKVVGKLNQLQVKSDLFKEVKYYVTGNLEPEVSEAFLFIIRLIFIAHSTLLMNSIHGMRQWI